MSPVGKRINATIVVWLLVAVVAGILLLSSAGRDNHGPAGGGIPVDSIYAGCTIITASYGDVALFGNNEDSGNPETYVWVSPPSADNYGVIYFGYDNLLPQGGINEKGLAFDANALPGTPLSPHPELIDPYARVPNTIIMQKSATVEEAIELAKSYNWSHIWGESISGQWMLADATGDAVVISAGPDGELVFTRKPAGDGYLVSTNFNRANPENSYEYPCWRYNTATSMLGRIEDQGRLDVEYMRAILDAVHQEGASTNTLYSNIFDLRNGLIYLYYWHQFDEVIILNVAEEIARAPGPTPIRELFSEETVSRTLGAYVARYRGESVGRVWLLLVAGSLVILVLARLRGPSVHWMVDLAWGGSTLFFGPLGLVVYYLTYRQPLRSPEPQAVMAGWRSALGATVFDVAGYAIGAIPVFLFLSAFAGLERATVWIAVPGLYVWPLVIRALSFYAPMEVAFLGGEWWPAIRRRFPGQIVSLNFMLAGMLPIAAILTSLGKQYLSVAKLQGPLVPLGFAVSMLVGACAVYPFNSWVARRGFDSWLARLHVGGETSKQQAAVVLPTWRDAWGALLLSFVLLSVSVALVVQLWL